MTNETKIPCPKCGEVIDVNSVIISQIEEELKVKYNAQITEDNEKFNQKMEELDRQKQELERQKSSQDQQIEERVKNRIEAERVAIKNELKKSLENEQADRMAAIETELNEKSAKIRELNKFKAEIESIKREKEELRDTLEAEYAKKLNEQIEKAKDSIKTSEHNKHELMVRELKKQLEDQKLLTEEMKRKQEQGSIQLQGEVQELSIEEWLKANFALDTITSIKKGERGADCLQTVNSRTRLNCGTIYYESKRTKDFNKNWIDKFKDDIREKGADVGVLVTEAFPKGMERLGQVEGIWVCSYDEFKGLCVVLRESIIQISEVVSAQENKGDKMAMLYSFLTSNEFRHNIEEIIDGYQQMQHDLIKEKTAIIGLWKKREKQIHKVLLNITHMYGTIKGIGGSAIQPVESLEFTEPQTIGQDESEQASLLSDVLG